MDIKLHAALLLVASIPEAAAAQPTLRYNYEYVCNNERVVIGHCRADSDLPGSIPTRPESDYCAVYYPDRARKPNASEIPESVLRSQLISMLDACGAFGSTGVGAASHANPATASAAQRTPPAPVASAPPSVGSTATTQRPFCEQILQLKALAPQAFRAIDRGQIKGELLGDHASSLQLSGADCFISLEDKMPSFFSCGWVAPAGKVDARFRETGQRIADCLHMHSDMTTFEDGVSQQILESGRVRYQLETIPDEREILLTIAPF